MRTSDIILVVAFCGFSACMFIRGYLSWKNKQEIEKFLRKHDRC